MHMTSAIKDNRSRGKVGDFLKECIKDNSSLSIVSAYFTMCMCGMMARFASTSPMRNMYWNCFVLLHLVIQQPLNLCVICSMVKPAMVEI